MNRLRHRRMSTGRQTPRLTHAISALAVWSLVHTASVAAADEDAWTSLLTTRTAGVLSPGASEPSGRSHETISPDDALIIQLMNVEQNAAAKLAREYYSRKRSIENRGRGGEEGTLLQHAMAIPSGKQYRQSHDEAVAVLMAHYAATVRALDGRRRDKMDRVPVQEREHQRHLARGAWRTLKQALAGYPLKQHLESDNPEQDPLEETLGNALQVIYGDVQLRVARLFKGAAVRRKALATSAELGLEVANLAAELTRVEDNYRRLATAVPQDSQSHRRRPIRRALDGHAWSIRVAQSLSQWAEGQNQPRGKLVLTEEDMGGRAWSVERARAEFPRLGSYEVPPRLIVPAKSDLRGRAWSAALTRPTIEPTDGKQQRLPSATLAEDGHGRVLFSTHNSTLSGDYVILPLGESHALLTAWSDRTTDHFEVIETTLLDATTGVQVGNLLSRANRARVFRRVGKTTEQEPAVHLHTDTSVRDVNLATGAARETFKWAYELRALGDAAGAHDLHAVLEHARSKAISAKVEWHELPELSRGELETLGVFLGSSRTRPHAELLRKKIERAARLEQRQQARADRRPAPSPFALRTTVRALAAVARRSAARREKLPARGERRGRTGWLPAWGVLRSPSVH